VLSSLFGNAFHEGLNRESKEKWERENSIVEIEKQNATKVRKE
jgi:hypothetical protein